MTINAPIPTEKAVNEHLLRTLKHTMGTEYFHPRLAIGYEDSQKPHDMVGEGNKLEWTAIQGFALQYEEHPKQYKKYIDAAIEFHRIQDHHSKQWNGPHPHDFTKPNPNATPDGLKVGAADTILACLEDRPYNGGPHTYKKIKKMIRKKSDDQKKPYLLEMIERMQLLEQPHLELIVSIHDFPSIGVPEDMYYRIIERMDETIGMLRRDRGYSLKP